MSSTFGIYDKEKNKTRFNWGIAAELFEDPTIDILTTIE
jgi:hypothetical protein